MSLNRFVGRYSSAYSGGRTDFGGKTGTSNNHSDAWFVGVTPRLVTGVWVGGEYRSIHFRTGKLGQGSRTALPVCGAFFEKVWNDPQLRPLVEARFRNVGISETEYNCDNLPALEEYDFEDSTLYYYEEYADDSLDLNYPQPVEEPAPTTPTNPEQATAPENTTTQQGNNGNKPAVPPRPAATEPAKTPVPEPKQN